VIFVQNIVQGIARCIKSKKREVLGDWGRSREKTKV